MPKHARFFGAVCLCLLLGSAAQGQDLRSLPKRDPGPLESWLAMDDSRFNALIHSNWNSVVAVLKDFDPPGTSAYSPLGFAGPQRSCLEDQVPAACRAYMNELARINRGRLNNPGLASPFPK